MNSLKFITYWENQRARGSVRYVIRFTVSTVVSGHFGAIIAALITHKPLLYIMHNTMEYITSLLLLVLISVTGSMLIWRSNNKKFERLTDMEK